MFITFEGTDGAGKGTQIELLREYFAQNGVEAVFTREPGGTALSEKIRQIILDRDNREMTALTEAFLYAAARSQHVQETIVPLLKTGKTVVCDRFVDSSVAYQCAARGIQAEVIEDINRYATQGLVPDITIYLDITPEEALKRKKNQQALDRMEEEPPLFHTRVYQGYQALALAHNARIKRVEAGRAPQAIFEEILMLLKACEKENGRKFL